MDVRCERCKTEYEFDDARITEAGVTVKCTTCGHVFKVKKKALVFTVPVKPGETEAELAGASTPASSQREWKVRQASGNVFTFKELTTLQKWIVERKVSRDDEISLTGESWKRLGNIAELASFFQVVDEAQKATQLEALQSQGLLGLTSPATPQPLPKVPGGAEALPPAPMASPPGVPSGALGAPPTPSTPVLLIPPPAQPPPSAAIMQPVVVVQQPAAAPQRQAPGRPRQPVELDDDDFDAAFRKRGGATKWVVLLLLLCGAGGGAYWYYFQHLPAEQAAAEAERARLEAERLERERLERQAEEDKKRKEAEQRARLAVVDAGQPADAGGVALAAFTPDAGHKPEPVRDYDYWMAQADRLRERERAGPALDAYGKAADLQPDRAEPLAGKGMALLDLDRPLQAEASFAQALKLNGRYGVALIGLAEAYRAQGKKDEAIRYYEKYLDVLPDGPEAVVARNAIQRLKE